MNGVAFCLVGIPPYTDSQATGHKDGTSLSNENVQLPSSESLPWPGPRTVVLHKNSQGFGFTLRHFIVYPPESAVHASFRDEENGNGKEFQRGRLEPMDTIFVKNVRDKGPAHLAGLCTGDRLVKVNGESILGKTYSQVISLIQNSDNVLELSIMPKDEDILQLAYSHDAYLKGNDPYCGEAQNLPDPPPVCYPRKTYASQGNQIQLQNQLDNWTCRSSSSGPSSPLENHSRVTSPAAQLSSTQSWQETRGTSPGGVGHSSPAHRTEEIQYGMTASRFPVKVKSVCSSSSSTGGTSVTGLLNTSGQFVSNYQNHISTSVTQKSRKHSQPWLSSEQQQKQQQTIGLSNSERCQQALSDWYYSQLPRKKSDSYVMPPRYRSFSQDRLGEAPPLSRGGGGWPHSASQDTLLQPVGLNPAGDHYWCVSNSQDGGRSRSESLLIKKYDRSGHSLEMLDRAGVLFSPYCERPTWLYNDIGRTDDFQRPENLESSSKTGSNRQQQPLAPQQHKLYPTQVNDLRRLPTQSTEDQPIGYRSYSPSFYRKTGLLRPTCSFRDPSYTDPLLTWALTPKSSPPESTDLSFQLPNDKENLCSISKHEMSTESGQEQPLAPQQDVVLRSKPMAGRRTTQGLRHPPFALPVDMPDPPIQSEPMADSIFPHSDRAAVPKGARSSTCHLPPLPVEDDSLASIPYIDEPTSPSADLQAKHVPASSVVSSGINSAPVIMTSPPSPTFSFPTNRLVSYDCSSIKASRRSSYLKAITPERSKSCDEGLNAFRDENRVFSILPKRVKSFFTDGSLDSLSAAEECRSKRHSTSELTNLTFSDVRKEGWLHYKQILTEKGKKVGGGIRQWKRVYSILRSTSLFLYKDKREAVLFNTSNYEYEQPPINIRGCLVDIAYSGTKRKHALRLTTQDFCEYLLQAEDRDDMLDWIKVIRENSKADCEEAGFSGQALINKKLNDYRKQSPTGNKPDSSPKATRIMSTFLSATVPPRSPKLDSGNDSSPPKSPWGIHMSRKPKKSGPKVFGVRLEDCQPASSNKFIPLVVESFCNLVEEMGLENTGIYRVPGSNAAVSSLQEQLNKGIEMNPNDEKWQDPNVISSLLKSFFRNLPEPLFTDDRYSDFIDANRLEGAGERLKTMKKLIHDLPGHYFHTLKFLVGHLKTVADHSEKNKMEPRNLALVFGPTLVRTSEDNMTDMVTHMPDRYKIVETLIQHYSWFFNEEVGKDDKTPVDNGDTQPVPNIDHLLPNIAKAGILGEISDSTNSDSAKSKGSWGSKRDPKEFLTTSIKSVVINKRKKHRHAKIIGSSTDEDSEHEPVKVSNFRYRDLEEKLVKQTEVEEEEKAKVKSLEAERREINEIENKQKSEGNQFQDRSKHSEPNRTKFQTELLDEDGTCKTWQGPEERIQLDARSIVSGYSTLSTLGRSLASEVPSASESRGDEADDERSELVSESGLLLETDNESGFASRSLTQERCTSKVHQCSFLSYQSKLWEGRNYKTVQQESDEVQTRESEVARSTTPSSFSSSLTSHKLHSRPSFSSHKLIQCDTLARKKLKDTRDKSKVCSLDKELNKVEEMAFLEKPQYRTQRSLQNETDSKIMLSRVDGAPISQESLKGGQTRKSKGNDIPSISSKNTLTEQLRLKLLTSMDDMFGVVMRKPHSPETRRKKNKRRHTVVVTIRDSSILNSDLQYEKLSTTYTSTEVQPALSTSNVNIQTDPAKPVLGKVGPTGGPSVLATSAASSYSVTASSCLNRSEAPVCTSSSRFHQYL
ncbi:LOW QUALITY PROTEIN: rho GTPase-activating protein 23-like [Erpetoichthys calabaricus]|uniref:Rho GTPase activating protein 23a n=1 Tax=Erpetoichthys calabaricus TaxID=27687 RepID=A0A8C4XEB0_ERPCA|nr:LOW QUALITY PROTEIN: rho GTPase-activating protein 23-like [Erpetoichthys calabaricus]